ncbi:glycosyltransferase family 4 protein [Shewanella sp. 10N.286.48.A6]|uniref:glycosyltransferase family 4 protein n=1 Tax=Shewanella sp. 10N.286.48.A6 TaxID=1880833 RepID=UPI000C821FD7|nr:glycosyltransferase family 4 protein [Shewanella sp. 10N.286.48.A6]PMI02835.1 glycosyl transferase family 1 [Shewanella sp. 10N.286.48.A6]
MHTIVVSANTSWYLYNFRKNTIIALLKAGFKVIAIAPNDNYSKKLISIGAQFIHINIDQGGTNPLLDIKTFFDFYKIYNKSSIDLVLNFTPKNNVYSTLAAKFSNVKVINNIAGLGVLFINESLTSRIAKLLYKFSQRKADKVFFQNEDDRNLFINNNFVNLKNTERLPGSGVDLSRFILTPPKNDGVVRFLLVARMLYDKGILHYVESARLLKRQYGSKVEFRLLGFLDVNNPSAVSNTEMQSWVAEGIINYLGVSDQVEVEIAEIDCMVLPSFYREGVPKSLLEAAAMGKPIVTTDNIGCRETVDHAVNGFLCDVRSTESLTKSLDMMINLSHEERLTMGKASRAKVEREFDEKIVINKYLSVIESMLKRELK